MKIFVLNTGSSSIKYELFEMRSNKSLAQGLAEKIGEQSGILTHKKILSNGRSEEIVEQRLIGDHFEGLNRIVELLMDPEHGLIRDKAEISGVGHRVVHGGEKFRSPTIIDETVIAAIRENTPLAPLHNPYNLMGIEVAGSLFPDSPQVAVFDTAFHQTIPMKAFLYALPFEMYAKHRIRRYGFHGISHAYVAERAAEYLGHPLGNVNMITVHLGNGASMAAIRKGQCVDTSMGMTPLAGLVMGTRSGDVDPALHFFLAEHLDMSLDEIKDLLNKKSGLKGLCGSNDMREVIGKKASGDEPAEIALEIYAYRIKKYIGAYFAALEGLDCLVFTGGIGENAPVIRESCCHGLNEMGIQIDPEKNCGTGNGIREINPPGNKVRVLVIPTNEALKIAQETMKVIQ